MGTQVGRPFEGADGVSRVVVGQVYDFQVPYCRVRYPDEDWEELSHREMTKGGSRCQSTQKQVGESSSTATNERRQGKASSEEKGVPVTRDARSGRALAMRRAGNGGA